MEQNDMQVIIYKILTYLYECLKTDRIPKFEDIQFNASLISIPKHYWEKMIKEMIKADLIEGLIVSKNINGEESFRDSGLEITLKGIEYLHDNSGMAKAKEFLGITFQATIAGIIQSLAKRFLF